MRQSQASGERVFAGSGSRRNSPPERGCVADQPQPFHQTARLKVAPTLLTRLEEEFFSR
jgi:hypothetical protein